MKAKENHHRSNAAGFTLVELMVVIAIIAILATIVGVNVLGKLDDANVGAAQGQIKQLQSGLVSYKIKFKKFPNTLDELVHPPSGESLLDSTNVPVDPWGHPYQYTVDGNKYHIVSLGADGQQGGTGNNADISSDNLAGDQAVK